METCPKQSHSQSKVVNYAINMQKSKFYKCSSLYFDNDMTRSWFLTESRSFEENLTLYEMKSHSSEVADLA